MKPRFHWRHQYDQERDEKEGLLAGLECKDPSLTQQHFADDANINVIAQRFGITSVPNSPLDPSLFRDTTHDPTLRDILEARRTARDHFLALPAKLRKRFHNDPTEMWSFLEDPENHEEAVRLGLLFRSQEHLEQKTDNTPKEPQAAPPGDPPQKGDTFPKGVT